MSTQGSSVHIDSIAPAQTPETSVIDVRALQTMLDDSIARFWWRRLDQYRGMLESVLSPAERDTVEKLRIRFAFLSEPWPTTRPDSSGLDQFKWIYETAEPIFGRHADLFEALRDSSHRDLITSLGAIGEITSPLLRGDPSDSALASALLRSGSMAGTIAGTFRSDSGRKMYEMLFNGYGWLAILLDDGGGAQPVLDWVGAMLSFGGPSMRQMQFPGIELADRDLIASATPVAGGVALTIDVPRPSATVDLRLYNRDGSRVAQMVKRDLPSGTRPLLLTTGDLPAGTYLCRMEVADADGRHAASRLVRIP